MFNFELTAEADGTDATDTAGSNTSISGFQTGATIDLGDNWTPGVAMRTAEDFTLPDQATDKTVSGATFSSTCDHSGHCCSPGARAILLH